MMEQRKEVIYLISCSNLKTKNLGCSLQWYNKLLKGPVQ